MADHEVNWTVIEARQGSIPGDQKRLIEATVLADESRQRLTRADQVERWGQSDLDDIAEAHAAGQTLAAYYTEQQAGCDQ